MNMLTDFFLDNSRIELSSDGSYYNGYVADLPEIKVKAATPEQCRAKLEQAITRLLASEPSDHSTGSEAHFPSRAAERARPAPAPRERPAIEAGQPSFTEIIYEKRDLVATVTIDRADVYNAYSSRTLKEMAEALRDAALDDDVAVVVLTGAGDRAFCIGGDMREHEQEHVGRPRQFRRWMSLLLEVHEALRQLGKPTIARINGIVASGGNELNMACDLAIAADHAKFMHVETTVGLAAVSGASQWLPLVIGERRAREMLMMSEPITAAKALAWGLVNEVVPAAELDAAVAAMCRRLIERFPDCTRYTKKQLSFYKDLVWNATIEQAREWLAEQFASAEAAEGIRALAERREIDYRSFHLRASASSKTASAAKKNRRSKKQP